jgi:hypothetical protein
VVAHPKTDGSRSSALDGDEWIVIQRALQIG